MNDGDMPEDDARIYRPTETIVLGVDPSVTATGYAILQNGTLKGAGKVTTSSDEPEPYRIWVILSTLLEIIEEYDVDHVAVEEFTAFYVNTSRKKRRRSPNGGSPLSRLQEGRSSTHDRPMANPSSMYLMKAAQTSSQLAAVLAGLPLFLYPVHAWKGGPRVGKEAILQKATMLYGVETRDHNITDAIMIAHHHAETGGMEPERGVLGAADEELARLRSMLLVEGAVSS